jgi:hypothetical protein
MNMMYPLMKLKDSRHFLPPRSGTMTQQKVLTAITTAVINTAMQLSVMSYIPLVIVV